MRTFIIILMAMLILSNCAPQVIPGPVYFYPKVEPIEIELRSFSFYPNHIALLKTESSIPFTFRLNNSAQIKHNFRVLRTLSTLHHLHGSRKRGYDDLKNIMKTLDSFEVISRK